MPSEKKKYVKCEVLVGRIKKDLGTRYYRKGEEVSLEQNQAELLQQQGVVTILRETIAITLGDDQG
jgi:hypothetical protein